MYKPIFLPMALLKIFRNISKEIFLVFLSTLFIFLGYPLFSIILFPCWLYKQIALKLAQNDPKIGKILEGIDALFAGDDPYLDPLITMIPCHYLAGKLDVPTVVKVLQEKVIGPKLYPELTQRIVRKYGYHFWYSIDNFKVENHVRYLTPECPNMPITRNQLTEIVTNKIGNLPYDSTRSPWEILVVPNFIDDRDPDVRSVFILRVNHCLMDGYSIVNFTEKFADKPWKMLDTEALKKKRKSTDKFIEFYKFVMLLLVGPYHFLKMFVFSPDHHQFLENTYKSKYENIFSCQTTPDIPDFRLKSVKNSYGVSMSSLLTTLCAQAAWKSMKRGGVVLPEVTHALFSYPLPGHGDILRNHWSLVRIPIKVNEVDPIKTLKVVEKEFQSLRKSVKPLIFFYANKLIALIPLWLRLHSKYITPTSFVLTNFPGPLEPSDICGYSMKHSHMGGKAAVGTPMIFGSFSSSGTFWFDVGGPTCNLPSTKDAEFLCKSIMETLFHLENNIPANLKKK